MPHDKKYYDFIVNLLNNSQFSSKQYLEKKETEITLNKKGYSFIVEKKNITQNQKLYFIPMSLENIDAHMIH
jgi:hypothetical protein